MSFGIAIALAVIGVACAAYGLKFFFSATKTNFYFFWYVLAAVLIAPVVLMATGLWDAVPLALHWAMAVALVLFVVYEIVISVAIKRHYNDKAEPGLDYIAVLGALVRDGRPGFTFSRRLNAAYDYLCADPHARCIVCGAQGPNESVPEAHAGRTYLVERGIAADRILLEDRSFSTAQNLRFAAELIDPKHDAVGISTNDYHLARALAIARKAGIEHVSGIAVKALPLDLPNDIVRESFAWAKDIIAGNA